MLVIIPSSTVVREAQLLIEPAFFWFVILGGTAIVVLAILKLIEFFSDQKMLFTKAERKRSGEQAIKELGE